MMIKEIMSSVYISPLHGFGDDLLHVADVHFSLLKCQVNVFILFELRFVLGFDCINSLLLKAYCLFRFYSCCSSSLM